MSTRHKAYLSVVNQILHAGGILVRGVVSHRVRNIQCSGSGLYNSSQYLKREEGSRQPSKPITFVCSLQEATWVHLCKKGNV